MAYNATSTFSIQNEIDKVRAFGEIEPIFDTVGGYNAEPALTIATDVFAKICSVTFPHKWNEINLPPFYTNSWQQDYVLLNSDNSSITNVEWLQGGVAFDVNNTSIPKPWINVECGRSLPQRSGTYTADNTATGLSNPGFVCCTFLNYRLYYGTWGAPAAGTPSLGNNPVAGSVYTSPYGSPANPTASQPINPITQIIDANGNLLVLTTYGIEGSAAPVAPINSIPGTNCSGPGATTVWTVVDPNGLGMRILSVPSQSGCVWQFNIVAQKTPPIFTSLSQRLTPLPDKYEPFFRAGFIAQCYRYSPQEKIRAKFKDEWAMWLRSLQDLSELQDRELEEYSFVPDRGIMGSGRSRNNFLGGAWPFNYPRS